MQRVTAVVTLCSVSVATTFGCGGTPPATTSMSAAQSGAPVSTVSSTPGAGRTAPTSSGNVKPATTTNTTPPPASTNMTQARAGSAAPATTNFAGMIASAGTSAAPATPAAGSGGQAHAASAGVGMPAAGSGAASHGSAITGALGMLGPVKPVMAGWATTNGLETLIYLSSAPLTCAQMMTKGVKWLSTLPAGSQVIEIVVSANPTAKSYTIGTSPALGGGEVNYAEGSKSSSTEVTGRSGTITLTKTMAKGVQEGMIEVTAPYMASGSFHAEWCEGGSEY